MPNIKAWRVGDVMRFHITGIDGFKHHTGRVIARYPEAFMADVMDLKGHVWRVFYG